MTTDQTIPPVPAEPPTVGVEPPWWHALYEPDAAAEAEAEPDAPRGGWWAGRLPDWRKGETVDLDKPELVAEDDPDEDPDEDDEPEDDEPEQVEPRPRNVRPGLIAPDSITFNPRQSIADALRHLSRPQIWALYNGAAAALGWGLGISSFVTHEITYLVATSHSPADPYCLFWYATAAAVIWADWRTRGWWPPLAWACRIPAVSLALGVLLYAPGRP